MNTEKETPKKGRFITLDKTKIARAELEKWIRWLNENSIRVGNFGYGTKRKVQEMWGKMSLVVRSGSYYFLLAEEDDGRRMPWEKSEGKGCGEPKKAG